MMGLYGVKLFKFNRLHRIFYYKFCLNLMALARGRAHLLPLMIGVGKEMILPSLRTVRAFFPHTALQLVVSLIGVGSLSGLAP